MAGPREREECNTSEDGSEKFRGPKGDDVLDGREGGLRSDQPDRVTVQNTLHYAPTGGRDQIVNIRTCLTNLGLQIFNM